MAERPKYYLVGATCTVLWLRALIINSSNESLLPAAAYSDVSEGQYRNVVAHQVSEKELAVEFGNRRN